MFRRPRSSRGGNPAIAGWPRGGASEAIWFTVTVPANAPAGVYTGRLNVSADGFTGGLPVKVEVMPWVLPAPRDWRFLTGLVHSPDTVALQYNVEPWSDAHLKLMEPSLRLLRDLGSESCHLFLIAEALIYERYSIVRWKGNTPDFTCVDKYLDLYQKSSALFGTISGSAVANVMVDGWLTIPLMKRTGFNPPFACAVEATASTGGQIMPRR